MPIKEFYYIAKHCLVAYFIVWIFSDGLALTTDWMVHFCKNSTEDRYWAEIIVSILY